MTLLPNLLARTLISDVIVALGGPKLRNGRCRAWFRGGTDPRSLSVDDDTGQWFDHGRQKGGGILALIQLALQCDKAAAVRWLACWQGETLAPLDQKTIERRRVAERQARELLSWRDRIVLVIRAIRNSILDDCRELDSWATAEGSFTDNPIWQDVAAVPHRLRLADGLDDYVITMCAFSALDLAILRRRLEDGHVT